MVDLDEIERLAKAALSRGEEDCESLDDWLSAEEFMSNMLLHPIDARFAEACTPTAILELVSEVRRLREDAERYRWLRNHKHLDSWWSVAGPKDRCANIDADIDAAREDQP